MRMHQQSRGGRVARGFTLVELLVVITIVGVMAAMLMPAIAKAKDSAKLLRCQSNQRGVGVATVAYAADSLGAFAWSFSNQGGGPGFGAGTGTASEKSSTSATNMQMSYFSGVRGLYCPSHFMYYWPYPDGAFKTYANWKTGQGIRWGYSKIVGTRGAAGNKPIASAATIGGVWSDVPNLGRYIYAGRGTEKHVDDASYLTAYYTSYRSLDEVDRAGLWKWTGTKWVSNGPLGPNAVVLWQDQNQFDAGTNIVRMTSHNLVWPGSSISQDIRRTVTGLNTLMADGHVEWAANNNNEVTVISVNDGQAQTFIRAAKN